MGVGFEVEDLWLYLVALHLPLYGEQLRMCSASGIVHHSTGGRQLCKGVGR